MALNPGRYFLVTQFTYLTHSFCSNTVWTHTSVHVGLTTDYNPISLFLNAADKDPGLRNL